MSDAIDASAWAALLGPGADEIFDTVAHQLKGTGDAVEPTLLLGLGPISANKTIALVGKQRPEIGWPSGGRQAEISRQP